MARVKVDIPDNYIFSTSLSVRISDVNYGGHTGNDSIVKFMHEARMNFLKALGIKDEVHIAPEIGLIVADLAVEYRKETFYNEEIVIDIAVDDFNKYGFDIYYHLRLKSVGDTVAKGKTGIVFFNYVKRKISSSPPELLEKLKNLTKQSHGGN